MIVADTSVIVDIAFAGPERDAFVQAIERAERVLIGTVPVVEARLVMHGRRGQRAVVLLDALLRLPLPHKGSDLTETDVPGALTP